VFEKYLFLAQLKQWLLAQPGSGSTVLAILRDAVTIESLGQRIAAEFGTDLWCHACQTLPNP
jgi:4-diphosphocytidyl-2-C-methyl-D-erythritol kinase